MVLERGYLLNNRYQIVEILGQGGMGSVYRAIDENLGVEVAVKDNLFTTTEYASQFHNEAVTLAALRHPNLPRVTDHFVAEGQGQYLVMDFIEGEDLRQRMDRLGTLPDDDVITIGVAVCDALAYLESRTPSVVHRDIKPGNIKITPTGNIYLVDFGLVKTLHDSQVTATGARAMTPGYSPPEQYGSARTDSRSDIYSLGATLYAALAGVVPEDSLARVMEQQVLTPIRKNNPRVSRRLEAVIEKSLEVRPENRYQSADEFKKALLNVQSSGKRKESLTIDPPPPMENRISVFDPVLLAASQHEEHSPLPTSTVLEEILPPPKKKLTNRRSIGLGCITFFILFLIIGGLFVRPWIAQRLWVSQFPGMLFQLSQLTPGVPVSWFINGLGVVQISINTPTPPGFDLPTATETQASRPTSTPTQTIVQSPTPLISKTSEPTHTPTLVPTPIGGGGGQIAFASDRSGTVQIYLINVDDTGLTKVTDIEEGACQPSFSPDGKQIVFTSPCDGNQEIYKGSSLYIINVDGSGLSQLPTVLGGDYDPAWSPDGKKIALTSVRGRENRSTVWVYNLEDRSFVLLSEKLGIDHQPAWSPDGKQIIYVSEREGIPQIWVMDANGENKQKITETNERWNRNPNWSPDKKQILFTQLLASNAIPQLVAVDYPVTDYKEYKLFAQLPMREGRFSPDGLWITYEGWPESNHDIFIMTSAGSSQTPLTPSKSLDFDPVWNSAP